jgi:trimethylamine:corrinoid methyltransferase-like protein
MSDQSESTAEPGASRRGRSGGRAGRREARLHAPIVHRPTLVREIPFCELLSAEGVALLHETAMTILEEIGIGFDNDDEALELWKGAGADVNGTCVRIPRKLAMSLVEQAPSEFTLHARNPDRTVRVGGRNTVFTPQGGAFSPTSTVSEGGSSRPICRPSSSSFTALPRYTWRAPGGRST